MKRAVLIFTMLLVTVALPSVAATEIEVSIPFGSGNSHDAIVEIAEAFNASQDAVKVQLTVVPAPNTVEDKLVTLYLSGNAPDACMVADLSMAAFASAGILAPLDNLIRSSKFDSKQIWPPVWEAGRYEGHHYTIPMHTGVRLLFANRELLRANGIQGMPQTTQQIDALNAKLTRIAADSSYSQVGFIPWRGDGGIFHTWAWAFGGSFFDEASRRITADHPSNVKALQWLAGYGLEYPGVANAQSNFTGNRTLAFIAHGSWNISDWRQQIPDFDFEVSMLPVPEGSPPSTWSGSWMWAVPQGSKHPEAAWEFIKFAVGTTGQQIYVKHVFMPPVNITAMRMLLTDLVRRLGPGVQVAFESMAYTNFRPKVPVGPKYWAETQGIWSKVVNEGREPRALLEGITKVMQAELDQLDKSQRR
jgi:multiple sugar transport system substrate-binding protein